MVSKLKLDTVLVKIYCYEPHVMDLMIDRVPLNHINTPLLEIGYRILVWLAPESRVLHLDDWSLN